MKPAIAASGPSPWRARVTPRPCSGTAINSGRKPTAAISKALSGI